MLAIMSGTLAVSEAITETDMERLTGKNGTVFVLAIVGLAFWAKSRRDEKNRISEDEAKERRHQETLESNSAHFQQLITMNKQNADDLKETAEKNAEALKDLSIKAVEAQIKGTAEIRNLRYELSQRPCGVKLPHYPNPLNHDPEPV